MIDKTRVISLDLCPFDSFDALLYKITLRAKNLSYRNLDEFFTGMLNKRVGQVILKMAGLKLSDSVSVLQINHLKKITSLLKGFSFKVMGTNGFLNSQVTAGGLITNQFSNETMMSLSNKGLYAVGEILDIDGDCGGFNLQWAWSSATAAAEDILRVNQ